MLDARTTVDIDEDVLQAAKELAAARKSSIGRVLSDLARQALEAARSERRVRNGVPLLPPRAGEQVVTLEMVNRLLDED